MKHLKFLNISERFLFYTGILLTISELWKQWTLTYPLGKGHYNWWYFPLQLCSVPMYLLLILPLFQASHFKKILFTFIMDFSLLGGIGAFLDTSGMHYPLLSLTCHSYLWHIILIIIGLFCGLSGSADYTWKGFRTSSFLFAGFCTIATIINLIVGRNHEINMFYISPYYPMNQFIIKDLTASFPESIRIFCYLGVILLGSFLLHFFWQKLILKRACKKKNFKIFQKVFAKPTII